MRIWVFNAGNQLPGSQWRVSRTAAMCAVLADAKHDVTWWAATFTHHGKGFQAQPWEERTVQPNYRIRFVPTPAYQGHVGLRRVWYEIRYAMGLLERGRRDTPPDAIICVDQPLGSAIAAARLARQFGAHLVLDIHDLWPEQFALALPRWLQPFERVVFAPLYASRRYARRRANAITGLCRRYVIEARRERPDDRPLDDVVIFNGVDLAEFRNILDKRPAADAGTDLRVVYAGTLGETYDVPTMLASAAAFSRQGKPVRFIIAGDGPLRADVERAAAAMPATISYVGKLEPRALIELYGSCQVGLAAYGRGSTVEMPDKAYDYFAAGLPIVTSLEGEVAQLIDESRAGLRYEAGNADSLTHALGSMLDNPEQRRSMAARSRELAERFDRRAQYAKFAALISSLARRDGVRT